MSTLAPMTLSPEGLALLKRYEACSLVIYDDQAGLPTIGWGHLIVKGENFAKGITEAEAEILLHKDLAPRVAAVNACLEVVITQAQFDSCVSLLFNIGEKNFRKSSFLRAVNSKASNDIIRSSLKMWRKVTVNGAKVNSAGLMNRRADEAKAWP